MSCTNCNKTYPLPICCERIEIGIITSIGAPQPNNSIKAYFINLSSNAQFSVVGETDENGLLVIDTETILPYFNLHDTYELKVLPFPTQNESSYDIKIDDVEYECLDISFFRGSDEQSIEGVIKVK